MVDPTRSERRRSAREALIAAAKLAAAAQYGRGKIRPMRALEAEARAALTFGWSGGRLGALAALASVAAGRNGIRPTVLAAGSARKAGATLAVLDGRAVDAAIDALGVDPRRAAAAAGGEIERWSDAGGDAAGEAGAANAGGAGVRLAGAIEAEGVACFEAWLSAREEPFAALARRLTSGDSSETGAPIVVEARRRAFDGALRSASAGR